MPWAKKLGVIVVLPLLCAYVGGWVAWRIADRVEFGFSSGGFEPAIYPIVSANWGKRWLRAHIGINPFGNRSEEHTSELQSLMRISYAVFCLKKKNYTHNTQQTASRNTPQSDTHN